MALIIALPALAFAQVPLDNSFNRTLKNEQGSRSTRTP
jgi:DHA2 family multidrug resistance protein-like MFS transporter